MTLTLLPAVDVAGGQAVRLVQGAAGTETSYGDPLPAALAWQAAGAAVARTWWTWTPRSAAAPTPPCSPRWCGRLDIAVELSGGHPRRRLAGRGAGHRVRPGERRHRGAGDARTGSGPSSPSMASRSPSGWTCAGTRLAARGWTREGGELDETLARLDARRLRPVRGHRRHQGRHADRAEPGPAAHRCARAPSRPVIASGGVSSLDDLRAIAALAPLGVEGAIVGKALYAGAFTLEQALGGGEQA